MTAERVGIDFEVLRDSLKKGHFLLFEFTGDSDSSILGMRKVEGVIAILEVGLEKLSTVHRNVVSEIFSELGILKDKQGNLRAVTASFNADESEFFGWFGIGEGMENIRVVWFVIGNGTPVLRNKSGLFKK